MKIDKSYKNEFWVKIKAGKMFLENHSLKEFSDKFNTFYFDLKKTFFIQIILAI